jgi:hypothetical protein
MSQSPSLSEVLRNAIAGQTSEIRTALPGRVESYDAATHKASVLPLIMDGWVDENGNRKGKPLPIVNNVPVLMPSAQGVRIKLPVKVGDTVLLVFCGSSLDRWLERGGVIDPADDRRHDLNDAVAITGLFDFGHVVDNPVQIEFTDSGQILVGGSQPLVTNAQLLQLVQAIINAAIPTPVGSASPAETGLIALGTTLVGLLSSFTGTLVTKGQ